MDLLTWQAPATDDYVLRHQRGAIRMPWASGPATVAGELVEAWVCCDPACGGVEGSRHILELNHACCPPPGWPYPRQSGRHYADFGTVHATGRYHGPLTEHWLPDAVAG